MSTLLEPMQQFMGVALVETIATADRVGLLAALEQPTTAEQLARRLVLSERALELMLSFLAATGYLERVGSAYRRPTDPDGMHEAWPLLEEFVRTGRVPEDIDHVERRGRYYAKSVLGLATAFEQDARQLAEQLAPVERIIDVGAGSGIWSLSMAATCQARVVAVDRPEVLPSTEHVARLMGLAERLQTIAGNYFDVTVEPADRIVLANVLHLESELGAERLIQRYAEMLHPGGELVIIDCFAPEGFEREIAAAAYDLHLGMRTTIGRAHDASLLRRWCRDAGLEAQEIVHLSSAMSALIASPRRVRTEEREMTTVPAEDLRALREECERYHARFKMVFDGAAEAIMIVDKQGEGIGHTNSAFRELLGVDWAAQEPHPIDEIVAPSDRERLRRIVQGLASGEVTERRHRVCMLRNGVPFDAELSAYDPFARSVICMIVRDHDRLARREKLQALGELVGALAHDLNTPLASLKANCALTQRLVPRLSRKDPDDCRQLETLEATTADALVALDDIARKLDAIKTFATLEGSLLGALAPHFRDGLAQAICERAARDVLG